MKLRIVLSVCAPLLFALVLSPVYGQDRQVNVKGKVKVEVGKDLTKQIFNMNLDGNKQELSILLSFFDDKGKKIGEKEIKPKTDLVKVFRASGFTGDFNVSLKVAKTTKEITVDADVCGNIAFDSPKCIKKQKSVKAKNFLGLNKNTLDYGTIKVSL